MPRIPGIQSATEAVHSTIGAGNSLTALDTSQLLIVLLNAVMQFSPVDTLCATTSANAISVPEFNTTVLWFAAFFFIIGGLFGLFMFGGAEWLFSHFSSGHGGGGGKRAAFGGIGAIVIGILVLTIPSFSGQLWTGSEQCFAMIRPMVDSTLLVR